MERLRDLPAGVRPSTRRRVSSLLAIPTLVAAGLAFVVGAPPASATAFSNTGAITVPTGPIGVQPASPYPSTITVSGLTGTVTDVNVTLNNVSHTSADDLDILVVAPGGAQSIVVSDTGGSSQAITNVTATFDATAAAPIADAGPGWGAANSSVTKQPSQYGATNDTFPAGAPAASPGPNYAADFSVFNGISPNGTWSLYVADDALGDGGSFAGGWSVDITTSAVAAATTTTVGSVPNPSATGQNVTFTATVVTTAGSVPVTTGTVTFKEGAITLASNVVVNGSGQASFSTSSLAEGSHTITALYNGVATFAPSNGTVTHTVIAPTSQVGNTYCNNAGVTIPTQGDATPYPSQITVSGASALLTGLTVQLKNVTHLSSDDIDVLLVAPNGQNLVLVSDAGGNLDPTSNVTTTFADASGTTIADATGGWIASSKPVNYGIPADTFAAPAPAPSAATTLASLNGGAANGAWKLFVTDDSLGEGGAFAGGWCLDVQSAALPTLAIDDVTHNEGNAGTTTYTFAVTRTGVTTGSSTVHWAAADNTATDADNDYEPASGDLTFNPGDTTKPAVVTVNGDAAVEPNETFFVNLTSPVGATVSDSQGLGTITNDDVALQTLSIDNYILGEGDSGTVLATFTVTRSGSAGTSTVQWATADQTATDADNDYEPASGSLTFNPGDTEQTLTVTVNGDTTIEPTETFLVNLSVPVNATIADGQGVGSIINDDSDGLSVDNVTHNEGNSGTTTYTFTVTRAGSSGTSTVQWATADETATDANNDYEPASGSLTFNEGDTTQTFDVLVNGDATVEPDETFLVNLSAPVNATISDGQGVGSITNDDATISINDVTHNEGDSGTTTYTFTLTRVGASDESASVHYEINDNSATVADGDYVDTSGTATFNPDFSTTTIVVTVNGDTAFEPNESFFVDLSAPSGATISDNQGVGTITNDDDQPQISIDDVTEAEGDAGTTTFTFTVSLSSSSYQTVTVDYVVNDGTATVVDNDYVDANGIVTFNPTVTSQTIAVTVNGDVIIEPDENFTVDLSSASNASVVDSQGLGTITNDDFASQNKCSIVGTSGNDLLIGTGGDDVICGFGGDDTIYGLGGNDKLLAGAGTDTVYGGTGIDHIGGGPGNDLLFGDEGNDTITGGNGVDTIHGGANNDHLSGNDGGDTATGDDGIDTIAGGAGDDSLDGGEGADTIHGQAGNDTLSGGDGTSDGADKLFGDAGNDQLHATDTVSGNDRADGGSSADTCDADVGDTVISCS